MPLFGPPNVEKMKAKRDVEGLIKVLSSKKYRQLGSIEYHGVSAAAAKALGDIGDTRAVEPLLAAFKSSDPDVYNAAGEALGKIGDARAVEPLIAVLKDFSREQIARTLQRETLWGYHYSEGLHDRRVVAAKALGRLGDTRAVEPLSEVLQSANVDVVITAAKALGQLGDAHAIEPLIAALSHTDESVHKIAERVLNSLGWPADDTQRAILATIYHKVDSYRTNRLVGLLDYASDNSRRHLMLGAAKELGKTKDPRAIKPLLRIAIHEYVFHDARRAAQDALVEIGDTRIVGLTVEQLESHETTIDEVIEAAQSLLKRMLIHNPGSISHDDLQVVAHLKNMTKVVTRSRFDSMTDGYEHYQVSVKVDNSSFRELARAELDRRKLALRRAAVEALGKIGDTRAVEPLIAALKDSDDARAVEPLIAILKDSDKDVRRAAVEVLGDIHDARAVEPLSAALQDPEESVRQRAAVALGEIGDTRAVEPLSAALKDSDEHVRQCAAVALGKIGDARAAESLAATLKDSDEDARTAAAAALDKIGSPEAWPPLIAALKDPDEAVCRRATKALVKMGALAVEPLIVALKDPNEDVRLGAAAALVKIGAPAVEPLTGALKDSNADVRWTAATTLGKIGDARAVEPLSTALKDSDEDVRKAAIAALEKLGYKTEG